MCSVYCYVFDHCDNWKDSDKINISLYWSQQRTKTTVVIKGQMTKGPVCILYTGPKILDN